MHSKFAPALLLIVLLTLVAACGQPAAPNTSPAATVAPATSAPATTAAIAPTEAPATLAPATLAPATLAPATTVALATSAATTAPAATVASTGEGPSGQAAIDLFIQASRAQLAQKAFRATIVGDDDEGNEQTTVLEVIPTDRFRLVTADTEFIIVPDGTFLREAGGEWQKSPMSMSGMMSQILSEQSVEQLIEESQPDDIRFAGADVIDGKPMWIYTFTGKEDVGGMQVDTASRTWIGALDKLPYRVEATSTSGEETQSSTITYEYDESIEIEAPQVSS
jgi:hypothetical protein